MSFTDIPNGTEVFVDANVFVYSFAPDPQFGPSCERLLERIEHNELRGFTSSHILSDVAHRLMSLEACAVFGWPFAGVAYRLKRHPAEIQQLGRYRLAISAMIAIGVQIVPTSAHHVLSAAALSKRHGLLSNDALVVALMGELGLSQIASHDADFDRVPGITRFAPI